MTTDILLVYGILLGTILLFMSNRLRLDLVALLALLALLLTGILTPAEALAGFADPIVLIIAGLFVVSGALFQTGVADRMGQWMMDAAGNTEERLLLVIMLATALLSGVMSSTGTVAVMLPVLVSLGRRAGISPSRLLIPLAFASLLGGMLTLIGTPPNIIVSEFLEAEGLAPFHFFDFTPIGLTMLLIGVVFMLTLGRRLLPDRSSPGVDRVERSMETVSIKALTDEYGLQHKLFRLRVSPSSPLIGQSVAEAAIRTKYGVNILGIMEPDGTSDDEERSRPVIPDTEFHAQDTLLVEGSTHEVKRLATDEQLQMQRVEAEDTTPLPVNMGLVEVLLLPRSRLIGRTLSDLRFRDRYRVTVVGIKRGGSLIEAELADLPLRFGDTLLVKGPWRHIRLLREERRDFVVVAEPEGIAGRRRSGRAAGIAVAIMAGMLVLMTFNIVPMVTAVLLAAVAMVLSGCLNMEEAYRSINWESVVLIAAILPMATALEITGGLQLIVDNLFGTLGEMGPLVMMGGLFIITSAFSQVISNTATTVLVAPIAFQSAMLLDVSPYTFLMTVAIAASTAFLTPIASPVNTIVLGPGNYRFGDFFNIGIVLQVLILLATLLVVPLLFPL